MSKRKQVVTFTVGEQEFARLRQISEQRQCGVGLMVRFLVLDWLQRVNGTQQTADGALSPDFPIATAR